MIDPAKKYRTRDGREVRIYAVDGGGEYPVHGATKINGEWLANGWTACGGHDVEVDESDFDLIEVRPRIQREVWVNVYPTDCTIHNDKDGADCMGGRSTRISCVKLVIDCEEGVGLD